MTATHTIESLVSECYDAAVREGYDGERGDWEPTAADLEWVTDALGRLPTRQEWADAGLPHVGGGHVEEAS